MDWRVNVVGVTRLYSGSTEVPVTSIQARLLAALVAHRPESVHWEALADVVWQRPPATARAAVQNQVSRIRTKAGAGVIVTDGHGYRLVAEVDIDTIVDGVARAEAALANGDDAMAFDLADRVVKASTGVALSELPDMDKAIGIRGRLTTAAGIAANLRLQAALASGRNGWALLEAERLALENPHDEQRAALAARALQAAGRRGDALASLARFRRTLRDDLGLVPGPVIEQVEAEVIDASGPGAGTAQRPLVGRRLQVDHIVDAARHRRCIVVSGERGIGVTRLLREVRAGLTRRGVRVAMADCQAHAGAPGEVLVDLIAELGLIPELTRGVVGAFLHAVRTRASHEPIALIVDDLHHAGPTTVSALRRVADTGVGIVLGTHDVVSANESGTFDSVALAPLTVEEVGTFVERVQGRPISARQAERAHRMSGGNPAVLEAIGTVEFDDPEPADRTPAATDTLAGMFESAAEALSRRERRTVDLVAVAGDSTPAELLREVAGEGMDLALPQSLLVDDGPVVRFRHGALAAVAYTRIPGGHRAELHHALGNAAARLGLPAAVVASHMVEAADLDPAATYDAATTAAEEATMAGAHDDAARWYGLAADLALGERAVLAAQIGRGDQLRLAGDPAHSDILVAAAEQALDLDALDLAVQATFALLQLGAMTDASAPPDRVQRILDAVFDRIDGTDVAPVRAAASLAWSLSGHAPTSRQLFDEAEAAASTPETRRKILPFGYMTLGLPGDLERRETLAGELWDIGRNLADPVSRAEALHMQFSCALQRGDGHLARRCVAELSDSIDEVGDVGRRWQLLYMSAALAHLDDDATTCERLSSDAFEVFADVAPARAVAVLQSQLFALRMVQGRVSELRDAIDSLTAEQPNIPAWHAALALCVAQDDEPDVGSVHRHVSRMLDDAEPDTTWLASHVVAARAVARVGDAELADRLLVVLSPWSGRGAWQGTCSYGPVDTALGLLWSTRRDDAAARHHTSAAVKLCRRLGAPGFEAEVHREMTFVAAAIAGPVARGEPGVSPPRRVAR